MTMGFHPALWADAVSATFEVDQRELARAAWDTHMGYFFDLYPYEVTDGKTPSLPLRLFERAYPTFTAAHAIMEELLDNDPDLDWQPMTDIWRSMKPWWEKFVRLRDADGAPIKVIRDDQSMAIGQGVANMRLIDKLEELLLTDMQTREQAWSNEDADDFLSALFAPHSLLDLFRHINDGHVEISIQSPEIEQELNDIFTHLIQGGREFYLWLAFRRIDLGDRMLESLKRHPDY